MKKILTNNFDDILIRSKKFELVDFFSFFSGKKKIILSPFSHLTYLLIVKDASVDIKFEVSEGSNCQIFVLFFSKTLPVDSKITTHILGSHTKIHKHIFSFLKEKSKITVDAGIDISKGLSNVFAHLLEENIIFSQNQNNMITSLPKLFVASRDVHAFHGAKIEKINPNSLFYLQSKGLSDFLIQDLIINSYFNLFLTAFSSLTKKEKGMIKRFIQF